MPGCIVSYTDVEGVRHSFEAEAESLYEAVGLGIAEFRGDELLENLPALMTEFTILVKKPPVEHHIHLQQVQRWAQPSTMGGPAGVMRRQRVRKLLGMLD